MTPQVLFSERFYRLFKEGTWVVLGQFLAILGSLVGVRVLTGLLDPKAYGEMALGLTVAMLVDQAALGPLSSGVTRFYALSKNEGDLGGYLKAVRQLLFFVIRIIICVAIFLAVTLFAARQEKWIPIIIMSLIFAVFSGCNSIFNSIQNAARQRLIVAFHQGLEPWARLLGVAGVVALWGAKGSMAIVG